EVVNGKTFEAWREVAERREPKLLVLGWADVLGDDPSLSPELYPDTIEVLGVALSASYRFEPGADDDGVSLQIPLSLLPQLGNGELDFTIPAWAEQKLTALLEELPRALRRDLGDVRKLAREVLPRLEGTSGALLENLARAVYELSGVSVESSQFRPDAIP